MLDRFYKIEVMPAKGSHEGQLSVTDPSTGVVRLAVVNQIDSPDVIGRKIAELLKQMESGYRLPQEVGRDSRS